MKRTLLAATFIASLIGLVGPTIKPQSQNRTRGIIVRTAKPYDKVRNTIRALGGDISYEYQNVDAIAANVPEDKVASLSASMSSGALYKDVVLKANKGRTVVRLGVHPARTMSGDDIAQIGTALTHKEGHRGQDVVVAVIDSGIANAPQVNALSGSVIGGESFVVGDPVSSPTSTKNDPHGTQVASLIAAHAGFIFPNDSILVQSLAVNNPSALIRCPNSRFPACSQGDTVVPMIGSAPDAKLYAVKVFDSVGGTGTKSQVLAAMDRMITLRQNFNNGRPPVPVNLPCGTEDNACRFDSLPIQVVNMSLGNKTTFAGQDIEDELTERMLDAGITPIVAAGNEGFAAMTNNSPGTGMGSVTVGAENIAAQERVEQDLLLGLGFGVYFRPTGHNQTSWFSSRGPTADGRLDPDLIASGVGNYVQAADGSINFVEGTSFSTPIVSGAAAVAVSAVRAGSFTATELRNALIESANPSLLGDGSGAIDQGNGVLDARAALERLRSGRASSRLPKVHAKEDVVDNISPLGLKPVSFEGNVFSTRVRNLRPGEVAQFFVATKDEVNRLVVNLRNINPEFPPQKQNQLFGDDIFLRIADAPTSFFRARVDEFVSSDSTFVIDEPQTGLVRVALQSDWTNAGRISADLTIERRQRQLLPETEDGKISNRETIEVPVRMPAGKRTAVFELFWNNDWASYPTNDVDMILCPPGVSLGAACNFTGATLDSPERVVIDNPAAGTWKAYIVGFTINTQHDKFKLRVSADGDRLRSN